MDDIVKRAPLKVLIARRRMLLRGPKHIFSAILICIATYCTFDYFQYCWVTADAFCPSIELSNDLFKWLIALTQFLGIVLLLWDLDERMQTLTGAKLINYFMNKINSWWSLFFIRSQVVRSSGAQQCSSGGVASTSAYEKKATVEEQLEYLQRRIIDVEARIAKESRERKDFARKIESDFKNVYTAIDDTNNQIMKTVTKIHVGGYTRQLWSLFLIAYSTVLGVYV